MLSPKIDPWFAAHHTSELSKIANPLHCAQELYAMFPGIRAQRAVLSAAFYDKKAKTEVLAVEFRTLATGTPG